MAPPRIAVRTVLFTLLLSAFAVPTATAHGTVEAQELELFVIEDEGTDAIDTYGGYDIVAVFLGGSHRSDLGAGEAGDGFYFRIELYGEPTGPTAALPNTIMVSFAAGNGTIVRTITTNDGQTFGSDFDALDVTTEPLEVHIARAFLLWDSIGAAPGTPLADLTVTTTYGDDPRDVAPGGIYVPGTGGAAQYPDPTQIDGRGTLIEAPVPPSPAVYFSAVSGTVQGDEYRLSIASGLAKGEQHMIVAPVDAAGWNVTVRSPAAAVPANGTYVLEFTAAPLVTDPAQGARTLHIDLLSDVGGRLGILVFPDGPLFVSPDGPSITPAAEPKPAPGFGLAVVAVLAAVTFTRLRRTD